MLAVSIVLDGSVVPPVVRRPELGGRVGVGAGGDGRPAVRRADEHVHRPADARGIRDVAGDEAVIQLVVDVSQFQLEEQPGEAVPHVRARRIGHALDVVHRIAVPAAGEATEGVVILLRGQSELLQVVDALGPTRRLAGRLDGRHDQGNQDTDDGDDDQELDESEAGLRTVPDSSRHGRSLASGGGMQRCSTTLSPNYTIAADRATALPRNT